MELINHFLTKKPKEYNIFAINEKIQEKVILLKFQLKFYTIIYKLKKIVYK